MLRRERCEGGPEETSKSRKGGSANAKPRTVRMKEPSRQKKGVRLEETTKMPSIDEPIGEKMFATTDKNGRFKMFPLRTQARQYDDEVDSFAKANPQLPRAQFPLHQGFLRLPGGPRR